MQPFTTHDGLVAVLPRDDVDTDQIIPKQYLARTGRSGYADGCFVAWRLDAQGEPRADFPLNHRAFQGATVLVAGRNFGCGSSREHAAWALLDAGYRVVVASSFGDIFTVNALQNGLLPVVLPAATAATVMERGDRRDGYRLTVDLAQGEVRDASGLRAPFAVDPFWRTCLLEGRDPIEMALAHGPAIAAYEVERSPLLPPTTGLQGGPAAPAVGAPAAGAARVHGHDRPHGQARGGPDRRRSRGPAPHSTGTAPEVTFAIACRCRDVPGTLAQLVAGLAASGANIRDVALTRDAPDTVSLHFEIDDGPDPLTVAVALGRVATVLAVEEVPTQRTIFGKRVIVIGGGAQVALVAQGAVNEADRHNIRGERISVDTIPLVGEAEIAAAVLAVRRLPRAEILVLAGSLMGGAITLAVREVRAHGIVVISLHQAGSVVEAVDLVVTDPIQAGVMAVMAVAGTARFDIARVRGRRF